MPRKNGPHTYFAYANIQISIALIEHKKSMFKALSISLFNFLLQDLFKDITRFV